MNKNISAVYAIKNILKGRIYVGSTSRLEERKQEHFRELKNKNHANAYMQADYNICGKENFIFEILEEVSSENLLCEREQVYINQYYDNQNSCYNIAKFAGRPPSIIWTDEMKEKLSAKTKGQKIHPNTLERLFSELPTAQGCGLPEIYSGTLSTSSKITAGKPVGFIFSPCS